MDEIAWQKVKTVTNLILAAVVLWVGIVAIGYREDLRNCEEKVIEFYDTQKYCSLLCQSGSITPSGTPQQVQKNILIELPGENISDILVCQDRERFKNISEWIECNRIILRPPV